MKPSATDRLSLYAQASANALGLLGWRTDPPAIIWVLTQRCFYRCVHCDSWRDQRPIDGEALLRVAEEIAAASTRLVALSGGEPFAVKPLPEIVSRLKRAGKIVSINTNGHLLAEHVDWIVGMGVDHVQVSVDGHTAALHDRIRGEQGSFERILSGIAALRAARHAGVPHVSVCAVVMPDNVAHMDALVDRFAGVADAVELQPLHDSPGLLATSQPVRFADDDRSRVETQLAELMARHPAFDDAYHRGFATFLFEPEQLRHRAVDHCLPRILSTLTIREDGECRICRYPLHANVFRQPLREIWNAPSRRELYRTLTRDGCGEPCWLRCHTHPSPTPGRLLRPLVRATSRSSPPWT